MSTNLHAASSQWANRPADERFWTLTEMHNACVEARQGSATATAPIGSLRAIPLADEIGIVGREGAPARFTHYSFGQLAASVGAPAGYLRDLPIATAAECLNVGIRKSEAADRELLFHKNGSLTLRACLSNRYDRVWDADVCTFLQGLDGWRPPAGRTPPGYAGPVRRASTDDILPGQINIAEGCDIAPSGLYASDHDMFAFLVAPDRQISDGACGALMRGIFVRNSEVGDASLSVTFFLMQAVCGNHIVWNATGVHEIRVKHLGENTMRRAFRGFEAELRKYHDAAPEEERGIAAARKMVLGQTKEECLTAILKYAKTAGLTLPKARVSEALDVAEQHTDWYGDPRTVWAAVAGLTHASQTSGFADTRSETDKVAGKLMRMAF